MKALFKSAQQQQKFELDGFAKVPLLSSTEVEALMTAYKTVAAEHEKIGIPYITTSHSNDSSLITKVDVMLQKIIAPALEKYLANYKLLFGNFLIKMPCDNSETNPHQDITFVDESKYTSVNVWIALEDIAKENGCMYFLKGSHALIPTLRPTHDYPWAYEFVKEEIKKNTVSFTAKAGDAFIFNHAVVHGSYPNKTKQPRVAAVIAAYPDEAELIHYFLPPSEKSRVKKYSMTKDAYLSFVKEQPPAKGVYLSDVNYDFRQLSLSEFKSLVKKDNRFSGFIHSLKQVLHV